MVGPAKTIAGRSSDSRAQGALVAACKGITAHAALLEACVAVAAAAVGSTACLEPLLEACQALPKLGESCLQAATAAAPAADTLEHGS